LLFLKLFHILISNRRKSSQLINYSFNSSTFIIPTLSRMMTFQFELCEATPRNWILVHHSFLLKQAKLHFQITEFPVLPFKSLILVGSNRHFDTIESNSLFELRFSELYFIGKSRKFIIVSLNSDQCSFNGLSISTNMNFPWTETMLDHWFLKIDRSNRSSTTWYLQFCLTDLCEQSH
jgi:hypothetical protein